MWFIDFCNCNFIFVPNVHWTFVLCAFDVDMFMMFLYFTFYSPIKAAMRIFLKAKTFNLCPKEWKMFNFCVQMIKYSTVLLKSNPSIAQCTIMHIDVHNNLCSKTISIASMVCEMSLKLWIIFPFHSKKFIPISTSRSPRVRIVLELRIFFLLQQLHVQGYFS